MSHSEAKLDDLRLQPHSGPLFAQVKAYIIERINDGDWQTGMRIPSENSIAAALHVSKLTAHRALRELAAEGFIDRIRGIGSFVAQRKAQAGLLEVKPIDEEIAQRGGIHSSEVFHLAQEEADGRIAAIMELSTGMPVFHSIIVHHENQAPIQLDDRWVNPLMAPDYLAQDFNRITPSQYLFDTCEMNEAEIAVEASPPDAQAVRLLQLKPNESCLVVQRRTWEKSGAISTVAKLTHPGSRYRLFGRFRSD